MLPLRVSRYGWALALCAAWLAAPVHAQKPYPDRPVRLIVPFAPGSAADTLSRQVASEMANVLGQPMVV